MRMQKALSTTQLEPEEEVMGGSQGCHYIAGNWLADAPNGMVAVENPSDGSVIAEAPGGSESLAEQAVMAAHDAFESGSWAHEPRLRAAALLEFADVLEERADSIAELMAQENGKVLNQASHEIAAGHGEARYYAGVARNVFGRPAVAACDPDHTPRTGFQNHRVFGNILGEAKVQPRVTFSSEAIRTLNLIVALH